MENYGRICERPGERAYGTPAASVEEGAVSSLILSFLDGRVSSGKDVPLNEFFERQRQIFFFAASYASANLASCDVIGSLN